MRSVGASKERFSPQSGTVGRGVGLAIAFKATLKDPIATRPGLRCWGGVPGVLFSQFRL